MKKYFYKFKNLPLLHCYNCQEILKGLKQVSFDLGLSKENVEYLDSKVKIREFLLDIEEVEKIAKDKTNSVYFVDGEKIRKILFFDKNVYKLRLVKADTAPTLEINGIHMHRIKEITPLEDTKRKLFYLNVKNKKVLDICTGLGYTAILSKRLGCKEVITIEKDENVLKIAEYNPWSKDLENIEIINEDAFSIIDEIEDRFDIIIHDPPRFSVSPELYSMDFYNKIKKRLNKGGVLFHYVGDVWIKKGKFFWKEIRKRLRKAGFVNIRYLPSVKGLLANI